MQRLCMSWWVSGSMGHYPGHSLSNVLPFFHRPSSSPPVLAPVRLLQLSMAASSTNARESIAIAYQPTPCIHIQPNIALSSILPAEPLHSQSPKVPLASPSPLLSQYFPYFPTVPSNYNLASACSPRNWYTFADPLCQCSRHPPLALT